MSLKASYLSTIMFSMLLAALVHAYEPTTEVQRLHHIPPVSEFQNTMEYIKGIAIFPIIFIATGVVSLIVYRIIFILSHGCNLCAKAESNEVKSEKKFLSTARITFIVLSVAALIGSHLVLVGNRDLNRVLRDTAYTAKYYSDRLKTRHTYGEKIASLAKGIIGLASTPFYCANDMASNSQTNNYITDASAVVPPAEALGDSGDTTTTLDHVHDLILNTLIPDKSIVVFTLLGGSIVFILMMLHAYHTNNKKYFTVSLWFIEITTLVFTVIAAIEMAVVHGLADLCMDPATGLDRAFGETDPNANTYNLIPYYTSCRGNDPSRPSFIQTQQAFITLKTQYLTTSTVYSAQCQTPLSQSVGGIEQILQGLAAKAGCHETQQNFVNSIEKGLCRDGMTGILFVWLIHLLVAALLFSSLVCAYYIYDHVGEPKEVGEFYDKNVFGFVFGSPRGGNTDRDRVEEDNAEKGMNVASATTDIDDIRSTESMDKSSPNKPPPPPNAPHKRNDDHNMFIDSHPAAVDEEAKTNGKSMDLGRNSLLDDV